MYYAADAPADLPFPPPRSSLLRRAVYALRAGRCVTPRLRMIHAGRNDPGPFLRHLIEEPELALGDGRILSPGIVQFLGEVQRDVWEMMSEEEHD